MVALNVLTVVVVAIAAVVAVGDVVAMGAVVAERGCMATGGGGGVVMMACSWPLIDGVPVFT